MSDELARRKALTFEQAEGIVPLPSQLRPREVSKQFRALIWSEFLGFLNRAGRYQTIEGAWAEAITRAHIEYFHLMADDLSLWRDTYIQFIKPLFVEGNYSQLLGLLQYFARDRSVGTAFRPRLRSALERSLMAYRLVDDTLMPVTTEAEAQAISEALSQAHAHGFAGARSHLLRAGEHLTQGRWADSIRESVHSVEATARLIHSSDALGKALAELEKVGRIHPSLRKGFGAIYGYTSDEQGIRHPLVDEPVAEVDEADALFMIGACASFVSYLIAKARAAGIEAA